MQKQVKTKLVRCGLALILALVLIMSTVAPLFAEDLDTLKGEKQQLEDQAAENLAAQNEIQAKIAGVSADILAVTNEIAQLDAEINACLKNISALEEKIEENEKLLAETQQKLDQAKEEEAQHYEELKARLQIMYEYGDVNYLEILLGSKDISEFFSRIEYVGQMAEHDKKIQDNLEEDRRKIQEIEGEIQKTQLELDIDKNKLEKEKQSLENSRSEKQSLYDSLQSTKEDYEDYQNYLAQVDVEIQRMITEKTSQISAEEDRLAKEAAEEEARRQQQNNTAAGSGSDGASGGGGSGSSSSGSGVSNGYFTWPVPASHYISSPYGWRVHPIWGSSLFHAGTDIGADYGDSILAADGGTVIYAGYNDSYGYFVMISHSSGYVTLYAHCSQLLVYSGQSVSQGETIALVGSTGDSTGPHCHFEVRYNGSTVDGMSFF